MLCAVCWVQTSGFQPGATLPFRRHLSTSGDIFACENWERWGRWDAPGYLVSKARVLLNILLCPGQAFTGKNYSAQNVNNGQVNHVWNELPVQVRCTILDSWGWCTGTTQRDGMGREEGGGFRMGNTCIPVADSFWYLAKLIQLCKV